MPQSENILIVDANVDYANKLGTQLQSENFIIHYAENVIAAKDIVKHKSIHIALIDVHLTHEHDDNDWSGIELAMQIRAYTSVIMMAQRPTFEMVRLALAPRINSPAPASDFITKADDVETIITAIRKVLNFNQQQDTKKDARVSTSPVNEQWHPSSSGHFALNHQTRIAKVGDETIALTEREYRLMKFFMDNVDTVVTREDIVTQVLNEVYNPISDTNRVNNIISRLRRRIERPNEKPIVVDLGLGWMYPSEHQFVVSVPDHYLNLPPEPELAPQETAEEGEEDLIVFGDVDEEVDDEIAIEPPVEKSRPDSKLLPPPAPPPAPQEITEVNVDDILYPDEHLFQGSEVIHEVDVTDVTYFTAAGNDAQQSNESSYRSSEVAGEGGEEFGSVRYGSGLFPPKETDEDKESKKEDSGDGDTKTKETQFTAYYARQSAANTEYGFYVYAHLPDALISADIQQFAKELGGRIPKPAIAKQTATLKEGALLTAMVQCDALEFNQIGIMKKWEAPFVRFDFRYTAPESLIDEFVEGRVAIMLGMIEIASIDFQTLITAPQPIQLINTLPDDPTQQAHFEPTNPASMYQKIFISYSRKDTFVAEEFRKAQIMMGNTVFMDTHTIRAGEDWEEALKRFIREADVFQLFWSEHSASSDHVKFEWEYALNHRCSETRCVGFIRPAYWEKPLSTPPSELGHLHFAYVPQEELL